MQNAASVLCLLRSQQKFKFVRSCTRHVHAILGKSNNWDQRRIRPLASRLGAGPYLSQWREVYGKHSARQSGHRPDQLVVGGVIEDLGGARQANEWTKTTCVSRFVGGSKRVSVRALNTRCYVMYVLSRARFVSVTAHIACDGCTVIRSLWLWGRQNTTYNTVSTTLSWHVYGLIAMEGGGRQRRPHGKCRPQEKTLVCTP